MNKDISASEFTICSVSYGSKILLDYNWRLTTEINKDADINWLVAENGHYKQENILTTDDKRFKVFEGIKKVHGMTSNYHHALGMNRLSQKVKTRFVFFLDPDFYIIRKNWINDIMQYMQSKGLTFFGAPWHPKHYNKLRYFPCVHCLCVDQSKVNLKLFDFCPKISNISNKKQKHRRIFSSWFNELHSKNNALGAFLAYVDHIFNIRYRSFIEQSNDTGYKIIKKYRYSNIFKNECVATVYNPKYNILSKLVDQCLPDKLSMLPKRKGYYTKRGTFIENYVSSEKPDWEEFVWENSPFGFHIRGYPKLKRKEIKLNDCYKQIEIIINSVIKNVTHKTHDLNTRYKQKNRILKELV